MNAVSFSLAALMFAWSAIGFGIPVHPQQEHADPVHNICEIALTEPSIYATTGGEGEEWQENYERNFAEVREFLEAVGFPAHAGHVQHVTDRDIDHLKVGHGYPLPF